tara:strand:+ start:81 stop:464 length:384 start_codon:yes stop_codon:yes gene_type:complete
MTNIPQVEMRIHSVKDQLSLIETRIDGLMKKVDLLIANKRKDKIMFNRNDILEALRERECRVIFKKANGEERDMICTLQEGVIPAATQADPLSQKKIRSISEEVIPVWDINAEGWRSFRVDSIISFS